MTKKVHAFKATYGISKEGELTGGELLQNVKRVQEASDPSKSVEKKKKKKKEEEGDRREEQEKGPKASEMEEDIEKDSKYSARVDCMKL